MKRTIIFLIAFISGYVYTEAQIKYLLIAGTEVPVTASRSIDAYELKEGQIIGLVTANDVKTGTGKIVIPKGSQVTARVRTSLKQRVLANQKRRLIIDIKDVKLANGVIIPLCDGVASFTTSRNTGDIDAVPLKYDSSGKLLIPTDYVIHAKVEVTQNLSM